MERKQKATKETRRNNEKRKEKSRDAARCRRSRETEIFTDLSSMLPLPKDLVSQLDKASIMRLAIAYLRVRDMINLFPEIEVFTSTIVAEESVFLKSLEGFLLILSPDGDFIYISENVTDYIGITQLELMGQNIYEYSHPCDHDEIKDVLACRSNGNNNVISKSFFIRLKCTITNKGRIVNLKSASYKVIHCTGHMINDSKPTEVKTTKSCKSQKAKAEKDKVKIPTMQRCLVAVGQPIPHPSNIEAPLGRDTFLSKHSLDMKFTYADDIMAEFLGYKSEDLIGKSLYDYHHAMDSDGIFSAFKCLFSKGQCQTSRYRFLVKTGGYVWVMTQATVINDKMLKPQSVVCVNYVISGVECKDIIYSAVQIAEIVEEESEESSCVEVSPESITIEVEVTPCKGPKEELPTTLKELEEQTPVIISPRPQTATSTIFGPRTKEMSKGYLMFSEEEPGLTMLKDEPEDLTHLAPQAGDVDVPLVAGEVCVPLDEHPFLSDVLDDFLFRDNFSPLLTDEPSDPFISYRDSCDPSPQLLSPNVSKNSDSSLPSLNSPGGSLGDEDQMSTFMSLQMDDDPDLLMKAPYIPMNMGDDLPLLMPDDVIWSTTSSDKISTKGPNINSSLAQLLCSNANQTKINDQGGGITQDDVLSDIYNTNGKSTWSLSTKSHKGRTNKRSNATSYDLSNKRIKNEPKDKMSSELLHQLMSSNTQRGRPKGKSNWLLDSGQKATCISQPSESVLMNLLDDPISEMPLRANKFGKNCSRPPDKNLKTMSMLCKNSFSLLDPEATSIASFLDLTQQDFEVNAPVNSLLLQGEDLLTALEINASI